MAQLFKLPIHEAAQNGDVDALRRELESGVSPDVLCPRGSVPLHLVIIYTNRGNIDNRVACIRLLIDAGADVSAGNNINMTALMYAAVSEHPRFIPILLNAGADANHRDADNWTPLHYAIYSDRGAESIRILVMF